MTAASIWSLLLLFPATLSAQSTIGTITYQDWTGASAPEQNIRFPKLDGGSAIPTGLSYQSNRLLNAAGVEVPWQQMSNGDLMVRTAKFLLLNYQRCLVHSTRFCPTPPVSLFRTAPYLPERFFVLPIVRVVPAFRRTQSSSLFLTPAILLQLRSCRERIISWWDAPLTVAIRRLHYPLLIMERQ